MKKLVGVLVVSAAACGSGGSNVPPGDAPGDVLGDTATIDTATIDAAVAIDAQMGLTQRYIKASNNGGSFGAVAISGDGNTVVVGAAGERSGAFGIDGDQSDTSVPFAGAAYVFVRANGSWVQQAYIKPFNTTASLDFGGNVTISDDGNRIAVAALYEQSGAYASGAVYVFARAGTTWAPQGFLKEAHPDSFDELGQSLALSGDGKTLVVGAPGDDSAATGVGGDETDNSLLQSGAAFVFVESGGVWTQQAYLKPRHPLRIGSFGGSVAISADGATVVVGSTGDASAATGVDGDEANSSLAGSGAAFVFTRSVTTWTEAHYLKPSTGMLQGQFGGSVALSRDASTIAVGEQNAMQNAGAAYVFAASSGTWAQQAYLTASNTGHGDGFGGDVALSAGGEILVVGAEHEASAASGLDGDQTDNSLEGAGAAYLFRRTAGAWAQTAYLKALQPAIEDYFGAVTTARELSVSAAGTIAVGAVSENGGAHGVGGTPDQNRPDSGAVFIFE